MTENGKRRAVIFFLFAVVLVALLAAALPRLELHPGIPLPPIQDSSVNPIPAEDPALVITVSTFFKALLAVILVVLLASGALWLLRTISWKEFLRQALITSGLAAAGLILLFTFLNVKITAKTNLPEILPPVLNTQGPPLAPLPQNLIWLVWVGLAVMICLLVVWLVMRMGGKRSAAAQLRLEAERAMQALIAGQDFSSVIIKCYWQMSLALQEEQGIRRREAMTVREFEKLLETKGFPRLPIRELTRLFELARYGACRPGPADEQSAFACLSAIIQFNQNGERAG